jgi:hypothetical protein
MFVCGQHLPAACDCFVLCSNSIRVVKTVKQTSSVAITYMAAVQQVIDSDGVAGLFLRGLSVKIISNGISSILFTIVWKYLMELWKEKESDKKEDTKSANGKDKKQT